MLIDPNVGTMSATISPPIIRGSFSTAEQKPKC
jgi:hypothetical protein